MTTFSLIYGFRDAVSGQDFLAGVAIDGRALVVQEGADEWWMYGVTPGGLAAWGKTPNEAHAAFRETYRKVLFDIAGLSGDYDAFRAEVERFYAESDEEDAQRWIEAARAIRNGAVEPAGPIGDLPRVKAEDHRCALLVERLDLPKRQFSPADNTVDSYAIAAEAA